MPSANDDRIAALDVRISIIEHALELRMTATEKALALQAREYERRLAALNGEAERLRLMQATYLPREVYEVEHRRIAAELGMLQSFRDTVTGKNSVLTIVISTIMSLIVGLLVHIWTSR